MFLKFKNGIEPFCTKEKERYTFGCEIKHNKGLKPLASVAPGGALRAASEWPHTSIYFPIFPQLTSLFMGCPLQF